MSKWTGQLRFSSPPAEGRSSSFKKCWRSSSWSSRSMLRNFSTTDLHLSVTVCFKNITLSCLVLVVVVLLCSWSLTNLFACSSDDSLSMRLMDLPVLYNSDTWWNTHTQSVSQCEHASMYLCVYLSMYVCFYLHSSVYKAGWQACQCSDVGSIAGLADPFLQLVEKNQLISVHCCL